MKESRGGRAEVREQRGVRDSRGERAAVRERAEVREQDRDRERGEREKRETTGYEPFEREKER